MTMITERTSGILAHPTSFPGPFGIGDLGKAAYQFVDWLVDAGQRLWQVLPLGPTGYGDSPYQCFSAFAGNPMLIDLLDLVERGYLTLDDLAVPIFPAERVDFGRIIPWKNDLLTQAFARFQAAPAPAAFTSFVSEQGWWLDDFALFMTLKDEHGGKSWVEWPAKYRDRQEDALAQVRRRLASSIQSHYFRQWLFFEQWLALKAYANDKRIRIIGDIPIYVAMDSADAWSQRSLFLFDAKARPTGVAGVPPDYFSPTGQLWGNPLYDWEKMAASDYAWWIGRFRANLRLYDFIRIDHFRGFYNYWEVPGGALTAEKGRWADGPRQHFFDTVLAQLGELPLIAEDLGERHPGIFALRDHYNFPGMKILQFAWSTDGRDPFLPQNYDKNCIVYTGTHDNDTTIGWYAQAPEVERDYLRRYLRVDGSDVAWDLIRLAMMSPATVAIIPLQDCMGLGSECRMNMPGAASGNWTWRYLPHQLTKGIQAGLAELCRLYGRDEVLPETEVVSPETP